MCGFSNSIAFKAIDHEDIKVVENFVKGEFISIFRLHLHVDENTNGDCINGDPMSAFSDADKRNFFGIYSSNPLKFAFLPGERKLINALVDHVKSTEDEQKNWDHFQLNVNEIEKAKISWKGTVRSCAGIYFGDKIRCTNNQLVLRKKSSTSMGLKNDLFEKTKKILKSFSDETSDEETHFNENMIDVIMNDDIVKAEAQCIFCMKLGKTKKINVQYQASKNSYSWNFSNLKRHMETHAKHNKQVQSDISASFEAPSEQTVEHECVEENDDGETSQYEDIVFTQLSVQNLKMKNATFSHNESKQSFCFNMDHAVSGTVNISKIKADGNCMFGALAHQLFYLKLNSQEHKQFTSKLRQKTVEHIKLNFAEFAHDIKGRVFEMRGKVDDIDKECTFFINFCLPKAGFWGGIESLKAISEVYDVNILIFNENGDYYFAQPFNPNRDRIVSIAFRNAVKQTKTENKDRNHYDSVVEIFTEIILDCSQKIIQKMLKESRYADYNEPNKTIVLE